MLIKFLINKHSISDFYIANYSMCYYDATTLLLKTNNSYYDVVHNVEVKEYDITYKKELSSYIM